MITHQHKVSKLEQKNISKFDPSKETQNITPRTK